MPYATGLVTSLIVFAVGAILDFAVTVQSNAVNWSTVGVILMAVGAVGFVTALILTASMEGGRRYRRQQQVQRGPDGTYVEERGTY